MLVAETASHGSVEAQQSTGFSFVDQTDNSIQRPVKKLPAQIHPSVGSFVIFPHPEENLPQEVASLLSVPKNGRVHAAPVSDQLRSDVVVCDLSTPACQRGS